jgi:hypothetical protein
MGFGFRATLAVILGITAAFVAACGSSSGGGHGLLSAGQNSTLSGELSAISDAVSAGSCSRANVAVNRLEDTLAKLPASVNQRLAHNLGQGATTVKSLALKDCAAHTTSTSSTTSATQSTSTTLSTSTTTSTPTSTSATAPATSSTPATTPGTATQTSPGSATTNGGAGLAPGSQ